MFSYILSERPYGLGLFDQDELIVIACYFAIPPIFIWLLHLYLVPRFLIKRFTILNTVLLLVWVNLFIGFYNYTFTEIYIFGSMFDFYWLPGVLYRSMTLGGAVALLMVFTHWGWVTRRRQQTKKKDWRNANAEH